jgi:hypothetical protein
MKSRLDGILKNEHKHHERSGILESPDSFATSNEKKVITRSSKALHIQSRAVASFNSKTLQKLHTITGCDRDRINIIKKRVEPSRERQWHPYDLCYFLKGITVLCGIESDAL